MKLVVEKQELIKTIEDALKEDEDNYKGAMDLYLDKQKNYVAYLAGYIANGVYDKPLKDPPFRPTWSRENLRDSLAALKAHTGTSVEMEDDEYRGITHGIAQMRAGGRASINSLTTYSVE